MIRFQAPPLPWLVASGEDTYAPGRTHPDRQGIGVYDLLIVTRGQLFLAEDGDLFSIAAGEALVLNPGSHHYPTKPCVQETHFYWIHFKAVPSAGARDVNDAIRNAPELGPSSAFMEPAWWVDIPKVTRVQDREAVFALTRACLPERTERKNGTRGDSTSKTEQQIAFQQLLALLAERPVYRSSASEELAHRVAAYLQEHFRAPISYADLGEEIGYDPSHIARCMRQTYGCTPLQYVHRCRIDLAKRLLVTTNLPVERVAEEVGFHQTPYFTRCFKNSVGTSPSRFRSAHFKRAAWIKE